MALGTGATLDMASMRTEGEHRRWRLAQQWPWLASALAHGAAIAAIALGLIEARSPAADLPVAIEIEFVAAAPSPTDARETVASSAARAPEHEVPVEETRRAEPPPLAEAPPVAAPTQEAPAPLPVTVAVEARTIPPPPRKPAVKRSAPVEVATPPVPPQPGAAMADTVMPSAPTAAPPPQQATLPPASSRPGADADYLASLLAWLERHKEYPREAQRRRQEGTAILAFELDRQGRVLSYRVKTSSGFAELDREVEAMIRRAEPLPPMPADMVRARLELQVPVQFRLR
jgi:protein TonB